MIVNQSNLRGLDVSYSTAFNKAFDETPTDWQKVAMQTQSQSRETDYKWMGQMPHMKEWIGEREIRKLAAYSYPIKNKKFEDTIAVPREDIEDDQYGIYTPMFEMLGEEAARHPEILVFGAMKNGFMLPCYDGKSFYAADHPTGNGKETAGNLSDMALDEDSFKVARTAMMNYKGDNGSSLNIVPDLLVVSPSNEEIADWILNADYHNGSSNTMKGKAKVLVSPELSDQPDSWYLLDTRRRIKPFIYQLRKAIKITALTKDDDQNVFMRDEFIWGADGRSNVGYSFWQMAYGSTGEKRAQG